MASFTQVSTHTLTAARTTVSHSVADPLEARVTVTVPPSGTSIERQDYVFIQDLQPNTAIIEWNGFQPGQSCTVSLSVVAEDDGSSPDSVTYVSILDYGASPSAPGDQNVAAIRAALAAAGSDMAVYIPAGTYDITFAALATGSIPITANAKIIGTGRGLTTLRTSSTLTAASCVFRVTHGINLTMKGLTLEGPTYDKLNGMNDITGDSTSDCFGIFHEGTNAAEMTAGLGVVDLEDVKFTQFINAVRMGRYSSGGQEREGKLWARHCWFGARKTPVEIYSGSTNYGEIRAFDCDFGLDIGSVTAGQWAHFYGFQGEHSGVRVHRAASLDFDTCRFFNANFYAIIGDQGASDIPVARFARVANCYFARATFNPLVTPGYPGAVAGGSESGDGIGTGTQIRTTAPQLLITGCTFHSTIGISCSEHTIVRDCLFVAHPGPEGIAPAAAISNNDGPVGSLHVSGCRFSSGGTIGWNYCIYRQQLLHGGHTNDGNCDWLIEGNIFDTLASAGSAIMWDGPDDAYSAGTRDKLIVRNNIFYNKTTGSAGVYFKGGECEIVGNTFKEKGSGAYQGVIVDPVAANVDLYVFGNDSMKAGTNLMVLHDDTLTSNIRGCWGKTFNGTGQYIDSTTTGMSGQLRALPGTTTITTISSNRLPLNTNADTYCINDTADPTINTVLMTGLNAPTNAANNLLYDGLEVTVIALDDCIIHHDTTADGLHVRTKSGSDIDMAAGSVAKLRFSAGMNGWLEV